MVHAAESKRRARSKITLFFSSDPRIERNYLAKYFAIGVPRRNQQSLVELGCKNTTSAEDAPDARGMLVVCCVS